MKSIHYENFDYIAPLRHDEILNDCFRWLQYSPIETFLLKIMIEYPKLREARIFTEFYSVNHPVRGGTLYLVKMRL